MFTLKDTKLNVLLTICDVLTEADTKQSTMDTYVINPINNIRSAMTDYFKNRPVIAEMYNFMRGLVLHQNYSKSSNFLAWKGRYLMSLNVYSFLASGDEVTNCNQLNTTISSPIVATKNLRVYRPRALIL